MTYVKMTPNNVEKVVSNHYHRLLAGMEVVQRYECPVCHELERYESGITQHLLSHAIDERIAVLWQKGKTLKEIDNLYHMFQGIIPDRPESYDSFLECHHNVTKDSCFTISYLQCCDYPAYRIMKITHYGQLNALGDGGWSGCYRSKVSLGSLRNPRPASELYKHSERKK